MEKKKIGILAMFFVTLIVTAVLVPAVSAKELNRTDATTKSIEVDLQKLSVPFTKEDFYNANQEHYKFLVANLGESVATEMMEREYRKSNSATLMTQDWDQMEQIDNDNVYIWRWISGSATNTNDIKGPNNVIFYNRDRAGISSELRGTGDWKMAYGWTEYSIEGSSPTELTSVSSRGGDAQSQLEDGSYFESRYHLLLFPGSTDPNEGSWCFGNCHYEYWDPDALNHYLYQNSCDQGRDHVYNSIISNNLPLSSRLWVNLHNAHSSSGASGEGNLFKMA